MESSQTAPSTQPSQNTVYISVDTGFTGYKLRNFYFTNVFQGFVWMLFHFTVVYFFTILLDNLALVGIFLGFANFVAFMLAVPIGILQNYISTKKFFIYSAFAQLIAVGIFLVLIFQVFGLLQAAGNSITPEFLKSTSDWFFGNAINIFVVIIAATCYGVAAEVMSVVSFGYVLSNANPSEYGIILSRQNVTYGIGTLIGLVLSGVLLMFPNMLSLLILGGIIVVFIAYMSKFFDNSRDSITAENIKQFKVSLAKFNVENVKEYLTDTIKNTDLKKVVQSTKYIFLKPKQRAPEGEKIPWNTLFPATIRDMRIIWDIVTNHPLQYGLLWALILVLIFGFWDTFATSFLVDFLNKVWSGGSYILLAVIGVPGILLQEYAIRISQKIGVKTVGIIGLSLSAVSLVVMGIMAIGAVPTVAALIIVALVNSLGYACGMAVGQASFLELYNRVYAQKQNLKEIDDNASSGPMNIIQNLANVIGLTLGGLLLAWGFSFFFFVFAAIIIYALFWSLKHRDGIVL